MTFSFGRQVWIALRTATAALGWAVAALGTGDASAATVTPFAALNDVGSSIVTRYGTSGYDLYNTESSNSSVSTGTDSGPFLSGARLTSLPPYIASVTANGAGSSYSSNTYALVDLPGGAGQVHTGFTYRYSSPNVAQTLLRITLGQNVPSTFYIGAMTNLNNGAVDFPDAFQLKQSGVGDSGLFNTSGPIDGGLDAYFFQVSNASQGDVFDLYLTGHVRQALDNQVHLGTPGLLFSTAAPAATGVPLPPAVGPAILTAIFASGAAACTRRRNPAL